VSGNPAAGARPLADARQILLLERLVAGVEGLREDLRSALADLAAASHHVDDVGGADDKPVEDGTHDPLRLLTASELAGLLRVDERTLRQLRGQGGFPEPIQVGRRLRWRAADIERWVAQGGGG